MVETQYSEQYRSQEWERASDNSSWEISAVFKDEYCVNLINNSIQSEKIEFMTNASYGKAHYFFEMYKDKLTVEKKRMDFLQNFWRYFPGKSTPSDDPKIIEITNKVEELMWDEDGLKEYNDWAITHLVELYSKRLEWFEKSVREKELIDYEKWLREGWALFSKSIKNEWIYTNYYWVYVALR